MKIRKKVVKTHHCDVCDTGYADSKDAKECEAHPIEAPFARINDQVTLRGKRTCSVNSDKSYVAKGRVADITKPQSVPFGEVLKLYGRKSEVKAHPIGYIISYRCPHCQSDYKYVAYNHEFKVTKLATAN